MQKGENRVSWRATVTEAATVLMFKTHCGNPGSVLGTHVQLNFLHLVLQVWQSNIIHQYLYFLRASCLPLQLTQLGKPDLYWGRRHSDRTLEVVGLFPLGILRFESDVLAPESWADAGPLDQGPHLMLFSCLSKKWVSKPRLKIRCVLLPGHS